jgi:cytochrome P450
MAKPASNFQKLILFVIELDDEDIIAQSLLFFVAGFDTSSTLMCFASHLLAVHPDVQTRLQEEIDKTLKEHDGKFTYEMVHGMKYLDMVVSGENIKLFIYIN